MIARVLSRGFVLWVLLAGALAYAFPQPFLPVGPWIAPLLGVVMLGMGVTLQPADFLRVGRAPRAVLVVLAAQWLVMPLVAYGLVHALALPPAIAAGVVLVGAAPGGTASNVITLLGRGDVALSVTCTAVSTLLAPLLMPAWVVLLLGASVDVGYGELFASIAMIVLVPVLLGVALRHLLDRHAPRAVPAVLETAPAVSVVAVAVIVGAVVAMNREALGDVAWPVLLAVVLHNALGLAAGHGAGRLARLPTDQRRACAFEVGMQNSGLAVALATAHFAPPAALAGVAFSVWHNVTGAALANLHQLHDRVAGNPTRHPLS